MRTAGGSALVAVLDAVVIAFLTGADALARKWRQRGSGGTALRAKQPARRVVDLTEPDLTGVTGHH